MNSLINRAVAGDNEASKLLREAGIASLKNRAGLLPSVTLEPLPITEQEFSEQTRSTRKTQHIRTMQWIQSLNRYTFTDNPFFLSYEDTMQIQFITYKKYLEDEK